MLCVQAYVEKRDALLEASEEAEQLQAAIADLKDDVKALKAKAALLESTRRGCSCRYSGNSKTSQAGRCINCSCTKAGTECSTKCSCGTNCQRPSKEKKEALRLDKEIRSRIDKINKRKGGKAAREESDSDSGSDSADGGEEGEESGSEESSEEEAPRAKAGKKKDKKKQRAQESESSSDSEEGEARPAAAARRGRDDHDSADSAAEACNRLSVDDNEEGEMDE